MNCLSVMWINCDLFWCQLRNKRLFPRKVTTLVRRRERSLRHLLNSLTWHLCVWVLLFVLDYEMYSCRYGNYPSEKYLRLEEDEHFDLQDKRYELSVYIQNVRFLNDYVLLISTMICFACVFFWWQEWQVLDGWVFWWHFQHRDIVR